MKLAGPVSYEIRFTADRLVSVTGPGGATKFAAPASRPGPKLYVVSANDAPVYVGITSQSIRNRLRYGFSARGAHGYHGYRWRDIANATLDIWFQEDSSGGSTEIEAVEAEVVFLIRELTGQWPLYQAEIHFQQSTEEQRQAARKVMLNYPIKGS